MNTTLSPAEQALMDLLDAFHEGRACSQINRRHPYP